MSVTAIIQNSRKSKSGKYPIKIRVTEMINGKPKITHFPQKGAIAKVTEDNWDPKNGVVLGAHPLFETINLEIKRIIFDLEKKSIKGEKLELGDQESFYHWLEKVMKNYDPLEPTYSAFEWVHKCLKRYRPNLKLKDITEFFLIEYKNHLLAHGNNSKKAGNSINSISLMFSKIRYIMRLAMNAGVIEYHKNPFHTFKIKTVRNQKVPLNFEEILVFQAADLKKAEKRARDWWLISLYCGGVRFNDFCRFNPTKFNGNRLRYIPQKTRNTTGIVRDVEIPEEAIKLLQEYNFTFPIEIDFSAGYAAVQIVRCNMTGQLKKACKTAGIPEQSFHKTRNAVAGLGIKGGATTREMKEVFGHASERSTVIYMMPYYRDQADSGMKKLFPIKGGKSDQIAG